MKSKKSIYTSIFFLIGLLTLFINDHFLKDLYHNHLTGKLSDIAGLFIFPAFLYSIFRIKKKGIYLSTALLFILWKSPLVDPIINSWNLTGLFNIQRVVDYSDLWTLIVLPISYFTPFERAQLNIRTTFKPIIAIFSILVLCSTAGTHGKIISFDLQESMSQIESKLIAMDSLNNIEIINNTDPGGINRPGYLDCNIKLKNGELIKYKLHFYGGEEYWDTHPNDSRLSIIYINGKSDDDFGIFDNKEKKNTIKIFENQVIKKLKE